MLSESGLKRLVIFQGVFLAVGLLVVLGTILFRLFNPEEEGIAEQAGAVEIILPEVAGHEVALPKGTRLLGYTSDGHVLILHLKTSEGRDRVIALQLPDGLSLGDFELAPE